jgi:hypothetical protein
MATKTVDAVLEGAVELARAAAEEVAARPSDVGEHLGTVVESERVVSHRFAAAAPGYRGWHWTVTLARVPRGRSATVSEVELLPGDDALLAKPWVPWAERLRPGDLGPGDVLPFRPDDPRLIPGWQPSGEEDDPPIEELALLRARALGPQGREEAAQRWHLGQPGPTSPVALASTSPCASCGFLVPLSGSLGQVFGVCANEWSPDDGRVVSMDHGCGAHSETDAPAPSSDWPAPPVDTEYLVEPREPRAAGEAQAEEGTAGSDAVQADAAEAPAEAHAETEPAEAVAEAPAEAVAEESAVEPAGEAPAADVPAETEPAEAEPVEETAEAPAEEA